MNQADKIVLDTLRESPQGMKAVLSIFIETGRIVITQPLEVLTDNEVRKLFNKVVEMAEANKKGWSEIDLDNREIN